MAFTNPKENIKELGLDSSMIVADFGAGAGNYTLQAASYLEDGRVYAIDIQKGLLNKIKNTSEEEGFGNVEIIWADLENTESTGLADSTLDAVILSNILFLVENKSVLVDEVKRVLRKGGKVLVIDWADSFGGLGPQKEHVFPEKEAKKLFKENSFVLVKDLKDPGDHHYGFIVRLDS